MIREPKAPVLDMSPEERRFYEEISQVVIDYAAQLSVNERFLLSSPQRLLTSSFAASSAYWSAFLDGPDDHEIEDTDEELYQSLLDERPLLAAIARRAHALDLTASLTEVDTKFALLIRELRLLWETEPKAKVIVFSSFKPTLRYLQGRLRDEGVGTELLHGSVKRARAEILARFRDADDVRVLLSSEVGSEGVDLQFSAIVVNYDLPWNPMRLEQRIGRVDRLGQAKKKVTILNLIYEDTIDKRIYDRLYERLQIGHRALGELEAVLGEFIREITIQLFDPTLSVEQQERALEQTAQALELRRREEEQLEAEAGSLVQHGDYILERIMESRDRHRWLRGDDIQVYVRDRLLRDFPGTIIETSPPGSDTYRIDLSPEGTVAFQTFLTGRGFKGRTRLLSGHPRQRYRFTSSVVQRDGRVECISQLHPLVRFAAARDLRDDSVRDAQAVAACVCREELPSSCAPGLYVLEARRWSSGGTAVTTMANVQIGYAGARVATGTPIEADLAEQMMATAAAHGQPMPNAAMHGELADALMILQDVVQPALDRRFDGFVARAEAEIGDRIAIRHRALVRHFESKIESLQEHKHTLEVRAAVSEMVGETRKATNLKNLAIAQGVKIERLRRTLQLREHEIEAQRVVTPEESDVGSLFLQVEDASPRKEERT